MSDEAEIRSAGASDGGGRPGRSRSQPAPLQSRAQFLQNWDWSSVAQINGGLCERGRAQRGVNSEPHAAVAEEWVKHRASALTLLETFQFLKSCHRHAPFLFLTATRSPKLAARWRTRSFLTSHFIGARRLLQRWPTS